MKQLSEKLVGAMKKYKYVVLVLLLGIVLLLLPTGEAKAEKAEQTQLDEAGYAKQMEADLSSMLSQVQGAGRVEVMLTLACSSRTEYQTDFQRSTDSGTDSEKRKTVILSEGSAYDKAAISAVQYPQFQGALILCQGADSAAVRLDILNAVSALTGLGTDRITVVKMN